MDSSAFKLYTWNMEDSPHAVGENVGSPTPFAGQNHFKLRSFLRKVSKEAVMITWEKENRITCHSGSRKCGGSTGGGNSSSGAVLYG